MVLNSVIPSRVGHCFNIVFGGKRRQCENIVLAFPCPLAPNPQVIQLQTFCTPATNVGNVKGPLRGCLNRWCHCEFSFSAAPRAPHHFSNRGHDNTRIPEDDVSSHTRSTDNACMVSAPQCIPTPTNDHMTLWGRPAGNIALAVDQRVPPDWKLASASPKGFQL